MNALAVTAEAYTRRINFSFSQYYFMILPVDVQYTSYILYRALHGAVPDRGIESMVQSIMEQGSIYRLHYCSWCNLARCIYSHC